MPLLQLVSFSRIRMDAVLMSISVELASSKGRRKQLSLKK